MKLLLRLVLALAVGLSPLSLRAQVSSSDPPVAPVGGPSGVQSAIQRPSITMKTTNVPSLSDPVVAPSDASLGNVPGNSARGVHHRAPSDLKSSDQSQLCFVSGKGYVPNSSGTCPPSTPQVAKAANTSKSISPYGAARLNAAKGKGDTTRALESNSSQSAAQTDSLVAKGHSSNSQLADSSTAFTGPDTAIRQASNNQAAPTENPQAVHFDLTPSAPAGTGATHPMAPHKPGTHTGMNPPFTRQNARPFQRHLTNANPCQQSASDSTNPHPLANNKSTADRRKQLQQSEECRGGPDMAAKNKRQSTEGLGSAAQAH